MSHLYSVFPISDDREINQWLADTGIARTALQATSRYPTMAELRQTLARLHDYTTTMFPGATAYDIEVVGCDPARTPMYTTIWVRGYTGDDHHPLPITFYNGWGELVLRIVQQLTHCCGSLVVIAHTHGTPVLVTPETDLRAAAGALEG